MVFTTIMDAGIEYPFKQSAVRGAANKIMVAEPVVLLKPSDEPPIENNGWVLECGRFQPLNSPTTGNNNWLSVRHGGKSDATFADGHVSPVPPIDSTDYTVLRADY